METEAYCQCVAEGFCEAVSACHGHRRRTPSNETLFGEPGRFYVVVSYAIHHCVIVVTHDDKIMPRLGRIYEVRDGRVGEP